MEITEKLEPNLKNKWLTALRSGKYEQGKGELASIDDERYCCLGVLSAACGVPKEKLILKSFIDLEEFSEFTNDIPKFLSGTSHNNNTIRVLIVMNDGSYDEVINPTHKDFTFLEIADWIEQNL